MNTIACHLVWCTADHTADSPEIRHHAVTIDEDHERVRVVARWDERTDRRRTRPAVEITYHDDAEAGTVALTPREADTWARILIAAGAHHFAAELTAAAGLLAGHDGDVDPAHFHGRVTSGLVDRLLQRLVWDREDAAENLQEVTR